MWYSYFFVNIRTISSKCLRISKSEQFFMMWFVFTFRYGNGQTIFMHCSINSIVNNCKNPSHMRRIYKLNKVLFLDEWHISTSFFGLSGNFSSVFSLHIIILRIVGSRRSYSWWCWQRDRWSSAWNQRWNFLCELLILKNF